MHLQDAYFAEHSGFGGFTAINYEAPTSTVFTYSDQGTSATDGYFKATTIKALDGISGTWQVHSTVVSNKSKHEATAPDAGKLTPNFTNIGKSGSGS